MIGRDYSDIYVAGCGKVLPTWGEGIRHEKECPACKCVEAEAEEERRLSEMNDATNTAMDAAIWVTASPHEWEWTREQQVAMARYCLYASKLITEAVRDLEQIVCTKEPDDGVVLLSNDGSTHYDPETKCQVYDHEHFSPLGDALIALHKKLTTAGEDVR